MTNINLITVADQALITNFTLQSMMTLPPQDIHR